MENLHRLFILERLFQTHKYPIPIDTLLSELECSLSTFKRLITVLREQYGFPILYSRNYKGYYCDTAQSRQVQGLWFKTRELQTLLIIRHMLEQVQPGLLSGYLQKLVTQIDNILRAINKRPNDFVKRINIIPIAHTYIANNIFLPLCHATLENLEIKIYYQDINGAFSERILSPQRLIYYKNNWYLDAWCHLREALRTFWVAGIKEILVTNSQGKGLKEEILHNYFALGYGIFAGTPIETAHLRFTGRAAMRMRSGIQWHPEQKQENKEDGSVELWLPYSDNRELVMDIMRYGHEIQVLHPNSLKSALIKHYKMAIAVYEKEINSIYFNTNTEL